ncbi:Npt1/Npt2 family nucleotide transporter [Fodinibius sediminis]|uniref:ADP,ATP carrier protein n=1 Tax=Fodinibius sediminis TaxID=1214077 RepID=A0A521CBF8_9BACT|nr:Npt1/Npt2 family nucleotide transporter [Fodinibius sediminis]SMO56141.1 ATP/ADP translocase [Fodinibius sediminis]
MKKAIAYFYDVRQGEWSSVGLMFFLHFTLMLTLYLLKPARDSLFLSELGPRQLPFVYLLLAGVAIPVTLYISRMAQKYNTKQLLELSLLFYMGNLLVLRLLFSLHTQWVYLLFYIWVGIFGILVISQFWLYANALFDAAQSKRLFPLLNLGAITGAIAGSEGGSLLVWLAGLTTENLLYLSIGALGICWILANNTRPAFPDREKATGENEQEIDSGRKVLKSVFKSRYQLLVAGIIGMAMLVSTLVDYQFKTLATASFPDTEALTTFMGSFYGGMSIASLLVQVLLSTQIIKRTGIGGAVLSRPIGLLVGGILFLLEPVLAAAVLLQGVDRASRYSIDKTGRELLFLPLPQETKQKTKVFIDTFVNRFFRGMAGVLLLLFIYVMELTLRQMTYAVIIALGIWIVLGLWARKAYVEQFRNSLRKRYMDIDKITLNLDESVAYRAVREMLKSGEETRIVYGLGLLEGSQPERLSEELGELLTHRYSEIRLRALKLLSKVESDDMSSEVEPMLQDPEPSIRLEAVYYLCGHSKKNSKDALRYYLENEDETLKAAALGCMHQHGMDNGLKTEEEFIDKVLSAKEQYSVVVRAQIAQMLGYLPKTSKSLGYLSELIHDDDPLVVRKALTSIERLQSDLLLDELFELLKHPDFVVEVQQVLASYGSGYFSLFKEKFCEQTVDFDVRRKVPGIFTKIHTQQSADALFDMLEQPNPALRYHVIKALNKLKKKADGLGFNEQRIRGVLKEEACEYFKLLSIKMVQPADRPQAILLTALKEKMEQTRERLFRLAALLHNQQDIYGSYLALTSSDRAARAASIEFMDNILAQEEKKYIFPVIDSPSEQSMLQAGRRLFHLPVATYEEGMMELLTGNDIWLKACAIYSVSPSCPRPLQEEVRQSIAADASSHPLIRETAEYVINRNWKA